MQLRADDTSPESIGDQVIATLKQAEPALSEGALVSVDPKGRQLAEVWHAACSPGHTPADGAAGIRANELSETYASKLAIRSPSVLPSDDREWGCGNLWKISRPAQGGDVMPRTLEALQAEVMRLSPADRARLLDRLVASLSVDAEAETAWDELADEREVELGSGTATAVPLDVAGARFEARFKA